VLLEGHTGTDDAKKGEKIRSRVEKGIDENVSNWAHDSRSTEAGIDDQFTDNTPLRLELLALA
jgi:hypothetical protein